MVVESVRLQTRCIETHAYYTNERGATRFNLPKPSIKQRSTTSMCVCALASHIYHHLLHPMREMVAKARRSKLTLDYPFRCRPACILSTLSHPHCRKAYGSMNDRADELHRGVGGMYLHEHRRGRGRKKRVVSATLAAARHIGTISIHDRHSRVRPVVRDECAMQLAIVRVSRERVDTFDILVIHQVGLWPHPDPEQRIPASSDICISQFSC